MLKIRLYFIFLISAILTSYSSMLHAKNEGTEGAEGISFCPSSTFACVCLTEALSCGFVPPFALIYATNIQTIVFTFKDINITVDNESGDNAANWGVRFSSSTDQSNSFNCNTKKCEDGAITITANNALVFVKRGPDGQNTNYLTGTIVITLSRFKNGSFPRKLQNLINGAKDGAISVTPTYSDNSDNVDGTDPAYGLPYAWQADIGALLNPPALTVLSRSNGLVVNINPPADLSSANPEPISAPVTLKSAPPGNPSGYILAFWQARVSATDLSSSCSTSGMWNFVPNPISFNPLLSATLPTPPVLTCSYTMYDEATMSIGGTTNALGCVSNPSLTSPTPPPPYYNIEGVPALTADSVAVPASFTYIDKPTFLAKLIANPTKEYPVPGTCMNVVYVPGSQTSYGKMGIKVGEVFGVMGWVLNTAYTTADHTPNLSLSHSNLSYMTAGTTTLASLAKDPSLSLKSGDCFVATAASGDINSNSVFYWRVLRDEYLTDLGVTKFYYKHGPKWANWLNKHPKYKPAVNFVLEKTGAFFILVLYIQDKGGSGLGTYRASMGVDI